LAIHALNDPIKIICGDFGEVNADVDQTIVVLPDIQSKYEWLYKNIVKLISSNRL
jgi:hypothetical protein